MREKRRPEPIPVEKIELENFEERERQAFKNAVAQQPASAVANLAGLVEENADRIGKNTKILEDLHEYINKSMARIEQLEYALSGVQLQAAQLTQGEEEKKGNWREVYRMHNPEIKGHGIIVTTQERKEGHVVEHGYFLELWDNGFDPPEVRIRRMRDAKKQEG